MTEVIFSDPLCEFLVTHYVEAGLMANVQK